jgi:hypothetical protein
MRPLQVAGGSDPRVLAAPGQGRMRNEKLPALAEALSGMRFARSTRMPPRPCCAPSTSNIHLNPTLLTPAGLPVPSTVDGHSLAGIWHGQKARCRSRRRTSGARDC